MSDDRIEVYLGDITELEVDAIVNAADESLAPGGGVCWAIHKAAGPELAQACAAIGFCPTGGVCITPGFDLLAKHVIHAVGPIWSGGAEEPKQLETCYRNSLNLARENRLTSIAFPAISTGVYGYPLLDATEIAVSTVDSWLRYDKTMRRMIFAVFDEEAERTYRDRLEQ